MLRFEKVANKKVAIFETPVDTREVAQILASSKADSHNDNPFLVMNLSALVAKHAQWRKTLPRITPFYAVKCNDDPVLLQTIAALGLGFDCASKGEIDKALEYVKPTKIIYANPCKTKGYISHAVVVGVNRMTFDSVEELVKVKELHSNSQMILRIAVSDPTAQCPLGIKFGCSPGKVAFDLLRTASDMGIPVIGVSFHVGSGCNEPKTFRIALQHARDLFDYGTKLGFRMTVVDLGGGYPGYDTESISLDKIANIINPTLDKLFPISGNYEIIAEPGRFYACAPISVSACIISSVQVPASRITKNDADSQEEGYMYYMSDGVYGSFNCKLFDHFHPVGEPLVPDTTPEEHHFACTVWGPTCDGLDQVEECTTMRRLHVGDWLYYPNMGAYTSVTASNFNGFEKPEVYYVADEESIQLIKRVAEDEEDLESNVPPVCKIGRLQKELST